MWDAGKVEFRENFILLNIYIRKKERFQINILSLPLKTKIYIKNELNVKKRDDRKQTKIHQSINDENKNRKAIDKNQ